MEHIDFSVRFAVIGWIIVFGSLAVIAMAIALIRKADDRWQKHEEAQDVAAVDKDPTIDTTTLVLISAACATMIQGRFHIRSVRRLLPRDAQRSNWSSQGRAILHGSHVVSRKR